MDKLTRYNQRLLAIIGTLALIGLGLFIIISGGYYIFSLLNREHYENQIGVQIRGGEGKSEKEKTRTQQITLEEPIQLDTLNPTFLIPVSQVNLEKEEQRKRFDTEGVALSSMSYSDKFDSHSGLFNNFIYYEYKSGTRTKIFTQKAALTDWTNVVKNDVKLLLFLGTEHDSNKDKRLDTDDYQSLYAYYLEDKKLVKYDIEGKTILGYGSLEKTDLVYIRVGTDKNKDFEFDYETEPIELFALNLKTRRIEELIPKEMKAQIQETIDN